MSLLIFAWILDTDYCCFFLSFLSHRTSVIKAEKHKKNPEHLVVEYGFFSLLNVPLPSEINAVPSESYYTGAPVALLGPTELYLSQVNKSFWHHKIFKGEGDQDRPG